MRTSRIKVDLNKVINTQVGLQCENLKFTFDNNSDQVDKKRLDVPKTVKVPLPLITEKSTENGKS